MKELKCPHCGKVFSVDEAEYASIVNQVRTAEFEQDLHRRLEEQARTKDAERDNAVLQAENDFRKQLSKKADELGKKEQEIAALREEMKGIARNTQNEMSLQLSRKEQEITRLQSLVDSNNKDKQVALLEEQKKAAERLSVQQQTIVRLQADIESAKNEKALALSTLKSEYDLKLKQKEEEVEHFRDMKSRLSTKMVGETLEQHCLIQFNQHRMLAFPHAYFEKDNDASGGSKGDFIFRDYADGTEYISIMFEMKNEMEGTAVKHKNEDFFKKLDKDRKDKNCEYAVLVSLLEADNEYYNQGIVDVSFQYDKMYVIRPQFFLPLIGLLTQAARKTVDYKKELETARQQSIDVTRFEEKVGKFKDKFLNHVNSAMDKHNKAIEEIDKIIKELQKMKDFLSGSTKAYDMALRDTDSLSIRSLTYNNPTMKAAFDEARKARKDNGGEEERE